MRKFTLEYKKIIFARSYLSQMQYSFELLQDFVLSNCQESHRLGEAAKFLLSPTF